MREANGLSSAIEKVIKIARWFEPSFKRFCHETFNKMDVEPSEISGDDADVLLLYGTLV